MSRLPALLGIGQPIVRMASAARSPPRCRTTGASSRPSSSCATSPAPPSGAASTASSTSTKAVHALEDAIFYGNEGRIRLQTLDRQSTQAAALALVSAAIVTWTPTT